MTFSHQSVLLNEAVELLDVKPDHNYVDATLGGGGHASLILSLTSPKGLLIGIDQDPDAFFAAKANLAHYGDRAKLYNTNFRNLTNVINESGNPIIHGIILDLGVSSHQLSDQQRGFSYQGSAPLDMRMGEGTLTAAKILNTYTQDQLQDIFSKYGEERFSKSIARNIVEQRQLHPFKTTEQLTRLIELFYKGKRAPKKIHPATKIYQALRIEVNDELKVIEEVLEQALTILQPKGRISVISFHSLEDRIVKQFFKNHSINVKKNKYASNESEKGELTILTKKPILASKEELINNPRARSAKLRAAIKN